MTSILRAAPREAHSRKSTRSLNLICRRRNVSQQSFDRALTWQGKAQPDQSVQPSTGSGHGLVFWKVTRKDARLDQ